VALQDKRTPEEYREAIGSMLEEVDRLTRLVDGLLVLSRSDAASVTLQRVQTPVMDLAHEAVSLVEVLAEEKNQKLTLTGDANVQVPMDRLILRQAIINLLDNAIKYSPANTIVSVRVVGNGQQAVLEVEDQGPGISPEHRQKVFERFYRMDPARSHEQGGAGLGLAIADWAVRVHGGSIELDSKEGRGCIFRIVLPVSNSTASETELRTGGQP
jgi:signal transduction histidine kinase